MKKGKIFVLLLTLFLMQGVASAQQTGESSFNPSSYTINPKIKVGDSILMKADTAQTDLGNGTVLPYDQETTNIIYPDGGTFNRTLVLLTSNGPTFNDTLRKSNGTLVSNWQEPESFEGLFNGFPAIIMTTNSSLFTNIKYSNITELVKNCTDSGCNTYTDTIGNFSTTVNNNEVIINGTEELALGNYIIVFKYVFDKQSGWLKEYSETFTMYESMFNANDIVKLDLVTVAVSSGAQISSLSSVSTSSTPDFFAYQMLLILAVTSLFVIKKRKLQ